MRDAGGLVLLGAGAALRYGYADPDVRNYFVVSALFMGLGATSIAVDGWRIARARWRNG